MKITTKPYQLSPRLRRRRGNVMAVVMATIFVLTTLVLGLHHQQSVARASQMRSEAELRFREARKFAQALRSVSSTSSVGCSAARRRLLLLSRSKRQSAARPFGELEGGQRRHAKHDRGGAFALFRGDLSRIDFPLSKTLLQMRD